MFHDSIGLDLLFSKFKINLLTQSIRLNLKYTSIQHNPQMLAPPNKQTSQNTRILITVTNFCYEDDYSPSVSNPRTINALR